MLGENHSLVNEFPNFIETIHNLNASDPEFAINVKRYDELDREIRHLELDNAPIDDESMHQLKHDRAVLKDLLYEQLLAA